MQVGVSESTVRRWLRNKEFLAAYRAARRQVVENAISKLQQYTNDAVECLKRNLRSGNPSAEIRAAVGILSQAYKGVELMDLDERMSRLEQKDGEKQIKAGLREAS
jgi:hypothetical protein